MELWIRANAVLCRRDDTCVGTILSPGKSDESFVTVSLLTRHAASSASCWLPGDCVVCDYCSVLTAAYFYF